MRGLQRVAVLAAIFGLGACAPSKVYVAKEYVRPQRIAVLPMSNETNDLDGPVFVRKKIFEMLAHHGYILVPLEDIDARLKEQGFTDGGQLKAATPQKIGEWIGADGLLYTTLVEFNYILLGYYTQRTVKVKGGLYSAQTGEKLWEADRGWATRAIATNNEDASKAFGVGLAAKWLEKMTRAPLVLETQEAVNRLLNTLPR